MIVYLDKNVDMAVDFGKYVCVSIVPVIVVEVEIHRVKIFLDVGAIVGVAANVAADVLVLMAMEIDAGLGDVVVVVAIAVVEEDVHLEKVVDAEVV